MFKAFNSSSAKKEKEEREHLKSCRDQKQVQKRTENWGSFWQYCVHYIYIYLKTVSNRSSQFPMPKIKKSNSTNYLLAIITLQQREMLTAAIYFPVLWLPQRVIYVDSKEPLTFSTDTSRNISPATALVSCVCVISGRLLLVCENM